MARGLENGSLGRVSFAYYSDLFAPSQRQGTGGLAFDDAEAQILLEVMSTLIDNQLANAPGERERRVLTQSREQLNTENKPRAPGTW